MVHFELAPSHSSAISRVLAPVIPSTSSCDHSDHSLAGAGSGSSQDLAVGRPNLYGLEDVNKYFVVVEQSLAFPLALLEVLMTIEGGEWQVISKNARAIWGN